MLAHEIKRDQLTVRLTGDLDHASSERIRPEVDRLLEDARIRRLVLDLNDLSFMDSSGIGFIIGRYKLMMKRGGAVSVRCGNRRIDRILDMAGLYQIVQKRA